jgi:hypothetical protein
MRLEAEPRLRAITLFEWLQAQYPGRFPDSQRRTFERRVHQWRGSCGPNKPVMFPQRHQAGDLAASDFTNMNDLRVTIAGHPLEHLLYHFVLTYSNWESVSICYSESFEAFSRGFQEALWKLGGVPRRHRSDSLSAAVNNLSEDREFRQRYQDLMDHYQIQPQRTNPRQAHENGDVESAHGHLKRLIDQALLMRGSREFDSLQSYADFLTQLIDKRNASRSDKVHLEQPNLGELPDRQLDHQQWVNRIRVSSSSTIQVKRNTYSVPSRLIGHRVDVMIDADFIQVWYAGREVQCMPRLSGRDKHAINYRHVIDSLVRKPGAFENYQYHQDLFPTSYFRMAYDQLCQGHTPRVAARQYLKILQLAARDSQQAVNDVLRMAIAENRPISLALVRGAVEDHQQPPPVTQINVEDPDLNQFDSLLQHHDMEVNPDEYQDHHDHPARLSQLRSAHLNGPPRPTEKVKQPVDGTIPGTASADVSRTLRGPSGAGQSRIAQPHGISLGIDRAGVPIATRESDCQVDEPVPTTHVQDMEQLRLEAIAPSSDATDGIPPRWNVSGSPGKPAGIRQTRFGKKSLSLCIGGTVGAARPFGIVHHLQPAGATVVACQTGPAAC